MAEVTLWCSLEAGLLPGVVWTRADGAELNGTEAMRVEGEELGVESQLVVRLVEVRGMVTFTCTASLEAINTSISSSTTITRNSEYQPQTHHDMTSLSLSLPSLFSLSLSLPPSPVSPQITEDPASIILAVEGDLVTLNCSSEGYPAPYILWQDRNAQTITDNTTFDISSETTAPSSSSLSLPSTISTLSFNASEQDPTTSSGSFRCVASNGIGNRTESEFGYLIIVGRPGQPESLSVEDESHLGVVLRWLPPPLPHLLPITGYQLYINSSSGSVGMTTDLGAELRTFTASPPTFQLRPFTMYWAGLAAISRAGVGEAFILPFTTAETGEQKKKFFLLMQQKAVLLIGVQRSWGGFSFSFSLPFFHGDSVVDWDCCLYVGGVASVRNVEGSFLTQSANRILMPAAGIPPPPAWLPNYALCVCACACVCVCVHAELCLASCLPPLPPSLPLSTKRPNQHPHQRPLSGGHRGHMEPALGAERNADRIHRPVPTQPGPKHNLGG